jgi:plasmid stabilization system protein ParE
VTVSLFVPEEVEEQIRVIDSWWRENRSAAPDLFIEELASGFSLLKSNPQIGRRYPHPMVRNVRRFLLRSSRYHVYYNSREDAVVILSVWSALRGTGPNLMALSRP